MDEREQSGIALLPRNHPTESKEITNDSYTNTITTQSSLPVVADCRNRSIHPRRLGTDCVIPIDDEITALEQFEVYVKSKRRRTALQYYFYVKRKPIPWFCRHVLLMKKRGLSDQQLSDLITIARAELSNTRCVAQVPSLDFEFGGFGELTIDEVFPQLCTTVNLRIFGFIVALGIGGMFGIGVVTFLLKLLL